MEATTTSTTTLLRGWADKEPVAKEEVESKETTTRLSNDDTTLENDKTNNEASRPSENIRVVSSEDGDGNKKPSYFNDFVATVLNWVRLLRLAKIRSRKPQHRESDGTRLCVLLLCRRHGSRSRARHCDGDAGCGILPHHFCPLLWGPLLDPTRSVQVFLMKP